MNSGLKFVNGSPNIEDKSKSGKPHCTGMENKAEHISHKIEITTIYPADPLLRKHVDYYYILNPEKKYLQLSYTAYPNHNHPVVLCENTRFTIDRHQHRLEYDASVPFFCGILNRFTTPLQVTINGPVRVVNIIFKEAGLNAFLDAPFEERVHSILQEFKTWFLSPEDTRGLFDLFAIQLGQRLDQLLLRNYRPFENALLYKVIAFMHDEKITDLKEIEDNLQINRKALFRLFKKYTGISPTAYRRIVRFRQTLDKIKDNNPTLTRLAYELNFSDQSHFIKELRKLTGEAPSDLLKCAGYIGGSRFFVKSGS